MRKHGFMSGNKVGCCDELVFKVVCSMAFEPVIITDGASVVACNRSAVELFAYGSKYELLALTVRELIDLHFEPAMVTDELGNSFPSVEKDITFAKVNNDDTVKKAAVVNTKTWSTATNLYHTIAIRDIPVVRMAHNKFQSNEAILNLTAEEKFQKALLSNLTQMANALPSLVWIISRTGEILYQNARVMQVFGVDTVNGSWQVRKKSTISNAKECLHPSDSSWVLPAWMEGIRKRTSTTLEVRYRNLKRKAGPNGKYTYRTHLMQTTPIPATSKFVCFSVDIHDIKEANNEKQQLTARSKQAIDSSRLKTAFLSMISHEIRTPLFGIVGNLCLLNDTNISQIQRELMANIEGSSKLMMAVIQDILDFSRIEAGRLRISNEPFSFNRMLSVCSGMVEQAAHRKGLGFSMPKFDSQINAMGDSSRILQILNNLASNAIKFTAKGSVAIEFEHSIIEGTLHVKITVADTGIGFGEERKAQLFKPWVQEDPTSQPNGDSGLGLAITKSLVDMMKGSITTESEPGVGSRFTVELSLPALNSDYDLDKCSSHAESPKADLKFELYTSYPPHHQKENFSQKMFRILLVEDNPANQTKVMDFIKKMDDIECVLATDMKLALADYLGKPRQYYHLVLLDPTMGLDLCRNIRILDQTQILISISPNPIFPDPTQFGLNGHLPKPIDFTTFRTTLSFWLETANLIYQKNNPEFPQRKIHLK